MQGTETNSLFFELEKITQANLVFVEEKVRVLSKEQLSWSQNPEQWNIIHVLAHLNAYAKHYQRIMIEKIQNVFDFDFKVLF
jgi:hypothetical protein